MKTRFFVAAFASCFLLAGAESSLQESSSKNARPVLWRHPGKIAARDLFWGSGSSESAPLPPFTFVKEDLGGTKPKVHVTDARGTVWSVKFAGDAAKENEVHAEIAASRLTWAVGYLVEEMYYVHQGEIAKASNLKRAAAHVGRDGAFRAARFEKRPDHIVRTGKPWTFDRNPFVNTKELSGLKILTTMMGNWDAGGANTEVLRVAAADGIEDWYVVSDLGSTFGQMGLPSSISKHTRWALDDYRKEKVLDFARRDVVRLHYQGSGAIRDVPTAHARWFVDQISQLTSEQVTDAFRAGGASEDETRGFSAAFVEKIAGLQKALNDVE